MIDPENLRNSLKGRTGFTRLVNATGYSLAGFRTAFADEQAFRQVFYCAAVGIPVAALISREWAHFAILAISLFIPVIVELLNSAIENTVDRISLERNPLSKKAKDLGSAAQMAAQILVATLWGSYLLHWMAR